MAQVTLPPTTCSSSSDSAAAVDATNSFPPEANDTYISCSSPLSSDDDFVISAGVAAESDGNVVDLDDVQFPADPLLPYLSHDRSRSGSGVGVDGGGYKNLLFPPCCDRESFLPPNAVESILSDGYCVIPSVLSEDECDDALERIWDFVQDVSGGLVRRDDPSTWYPPKVLRWARRDRRRRRRQGLLLKWKEEKKEEEEATTMMAEEQEQHGQKHGEVFAVTSVDAPEGTADGEVQEREEEEYQEDEDEDDDDDDNDQEDDDPWPHTGYASFPDMFQSLGAGFLLGDVRLLLAKRVFEPLFGGNRELHCSKEGFTFHRPTVLPTMGEGVVPSYSSDNGDKDDDDLKKEEEEKEEEPIVWDRTFKSSGRKGGLAGRGGGVRVCGSIQPNSLGEHYDQRHSCRGLHSIQSSVSFCDQSEPHDGHFVCYPRSHTNVHAALTRGTYRGRFDWVPLTDDEVRRAVQGGETDESAISPGYCGDGDGDGGCGPTLTTAREATAPRHIYAKKGDVILWRSDLIHAAVPPSGPTRAFRAVAYCSMSPAVLTPRCVYEDKLNAYRWGRTGDHRCHVESWHEHKRWSVGTAGGGGGGKIGGKKGGTSESEAGGGIGEGDKGQDYNDANNEGSWSATVRRQRPYFRLGPPLVSVRLAELYGLLSYGPADENEEEGKRGGDGDGDGDSADHGNNSWRRKEMDRATVRGVRFSLPAPVTTTTTTTTIMTTATIKDHGGALGGEAVVGSSPRSHPSAPPHPSLPRRWDTSFVPCLAEVRTLKLSPVGGGGGGGGRGTPSDSSLLLLGQDKYLGGMASPCGRYIYGVPGGAARVLRVRCDTGAMDFIGPDYAALGKFKWLRGVEIGPDVMGREKYPMGCCVALPSNAKCVLKIDPATNDVWTFGDLEAFSSKEKDDDDDDRDDDNGISLGWSYHGGNLSLHDGCVYAIPANAYRVLRIDPRSETLTYIGPPLYPGLKQKWFGGVVGCDGCVYGIPHNATGVLKINPVARNVDVLADGTLLPEGSWKWHGGLATLDGTKIIGFPNNADSVLIVNVPEGRVYTVGGAAAGTVLASGRHRIPQDGRYKYLGGALTIDGHYAYLFPCDAERVLRIDCITDDVRCVGPCLLEGENKYQNGFVARDGCLYGIPQRASGVLRIVPPTRHRRHSPTPTPSHVVDLGKEEEESVDVLYCGEEMVQCRDKFEGGVMGPADGCIYCIPLRAKALLKVIPGPEVP